MLGLIMETTRLQSYCGAVCLPLCAVEARANRWAGRKHCGTASAVSVLGTAASQDAMEINADRRGGNAWQCSQTVSQRRLYHESR